MSNLTYNFFIDEFGHSGDDLTKSGQLFFTMASVGIPIKDSSSIEQQLMKLKSKFKIDF